MVLFSQLEFISLLDNDGSAGTSLWLNCALPEGGISSLMVNVVGIAITVKFGLDAVCHLQSVKR